ncbi:MAG: cytochrome d ubiquinol oxidase subunit II [Silvanigrellaceae bacterium]|nr:cytochrome d ubiquinol oxidase subunit II [Silvanigrellaceae bacterium]
MSNPTITIHILLITFLIYLIQDGRTLMLCVFAPFNRKKHRVNIFNDTLPSWDANQTWLVFTIAGLYGGFPDFFGKLMSQYYSFFFILLLLFILRGSSIEFYIKSSKYKSWWLFALSISSVLLLACHIFLCTILLCSSYFSTLPLFVIAAFILWFNFTQAYCFLFGVNHFSRLSFVCGLLLTVTILLNVFEISIEGNHLTSFIFLFQLALLISFLMLSIITHPQGWFSKTLPYYLFITNAFFIIQKLISVQIMQNYYEMAHITKNSSYFVINAFSICLLPLIALGLYKMKKVFSTSPDEITH